MVSDSVGNNATTKAHVELQVLQHLNDGDFIDNSFQFAEKLCVDHQILVGVLLSLKSANMLTVGIKTSVVISLTTEGKQVLQFGSPEVCLWNLIPDEGISRDNLFVKMGSSAKLGFSQAMKAKWIRSHNGLIYKQVETITDNTQKNLNEIANGLISSEDDKVKILKKRKLIVTSNISTYSAVKGPDFSMMRKEIANDLTLENLRNGKWKTSIFKDYNFAAKGKTILHGALHPLLKVRTQFRKVLLSMGFEEMPTNQFVESSFWNFDSLFQPQQHPARDAHDTFFVTKPKVTLNLPDEYVQRVKTTHEKGGFGSIGWRYDWSIDEAKKNLLRTHTTAVSSKMLYKLAQSDVFEPKKFFSIDRVFRNETVDATHLAEFHQVEGLIADRNLTLGDLIGVIAAFFKRIGISDVKFKPAYNPYTEPSMEIFGYSPELDKWMEVGNSGIFRPEMLRPMGLPEDVKVIAWGLSLERPTMIKYGVANIRDLFGHKVDLRMCRDNPICRFE